MFAVAKRCLTPPALTCMLTVLLSLDALCQFGQDFTHTFLKNNNLSLVIRSHECVPEGYQVLSSSLPWSLLRIVMPLIPPSFPFSAVYT